MKLLKNKLALSAAAALIVSTSLFADNTSDIAELKKQIAELTKQSKLLQEQSQVLIDETSDLKTGFNYTTVDSTKSFSGLGAAASKVYYSKSPLSIGGYGEMYYSHTSNDNASNSSKVDVYRFVPYIGYKFNDNTILNVELEFEHGGVDSDGNGGEVIVEFMYLDFLFNKNVNIRVGNMLMPIGIINERHEPTLFTTVQRPLTSKYLIPTTWNESGIMVFGNIIDNLSYKVAGVTALKPKDSGNKWLRGGRGGSFENKDPELGAVARVDYTGINGLLVGASTYVDSDITMWETHMDYNLNALRVYGTYTQTDRSNTTTGQVEKANGGYLNIGYDLLSFTSSKNKLPLFVQFESLSPQDDIAGSTGTDSIDITTVGINYFPHEQVVLKLDYAMQEQNSIDANTLSLSMGFIF